MSVWIQQKGQIKLRLHFDKEFIPTMIIIEVIFQNVLRVHCCIVGAVSGSCEQVLWVCK
jgi:hypothetical protein